MALALSFVAMIYVTIGEFERALEVLRNNLAKCQQLGIPDTFAESNSFTQLGRIYKAKGELEDALEWFHKALAIEETRGCNECIGFVLDQLGITYMKKGQLEVALEYMVKGLKIQEELRHDPFLANSLMHLVSISLELGQLETARYNMQRLEALRAKVANKYVDLAYDLARALLLKASPRTRDKIHAQMLFQQLAEEGEGIPWFDLTVQAILNLCELLFFEFKTSEDPEILHEIQTSMNRLQDQAKEQQSHSLLAETYLLQAKLALLDLDVPRAQYLLTAAQAIAEEKGLQLLTRSISDEHDTLLRQINQWKALQAQKTSPDEVSELTDLKAQVVRMIHKQLNEVSDYLLREITTSFQIPNAPISQKTHPPSLNERILHKYPNFKYDTISTAIISCLERKKRLNISQLTEEVRIQRGRASRRIIRERVNHLINQGIIEELDEGYGRQLRVIPLSDDNDPHLEIL
ncbi:MAG: tetratricopeptide repeat protein [Candidatus Heimdallarchaeota archaeon]